MVEGFHDAGLGIERRQDGVVQPLGDGGLHLRRRLAAPAAPFEHFGAVLLAVGEAAIEPDLLRRAAELAVRFAEGAAARAAGRGCR